MTNVFKNKKNTYVTLVVLFFILLSGFSAVGQTCGSTYTTTQTLTGSLTVTSACTLTVNPGVTLTLSGTITTTSGSLTINGGGIIDITQSNIGPPSGFTFIVGRGTTVAITNALNISNGATIVIEEGGYLSTGGGDNTGGLIQDSGTFKSNGTFAMNPGAIIEGTGTFIGNISPNNGSSTDVFGGNGSNCSAGCSSCSTAFTATATASPTSICSGGSSTLTATPSSGSTYQWGNNSGDFSGATSSTYSASSAGTYYVTVTKGGCSNTATVTLNSTTTAPAANSITQCGTGSATLTASGAPTGGTYNWYAASTGGTALQSSTSTTYTTPSISATTTYYVTASSSGGCESSPRKAVVVTINPAPSIPVGYNVACTNSNNLTYSIPALAGATSYTWAITNGNGGSTTTSPTSGNISFGNTSPATVQVTANPSGCSASLSVTLVSSGTIASVASATASPTTICGSGSSTLTATLSGTGTAGTPVWYTGSCGGTKVGIGSSISVSPSSATTYYVRDEIGGGNCVTSSTCNTVVVTVGTAPSTPTISAGGPTTFCAGSSVTLTGSITSGVTYQWNNNGSSISGATNNAYSANSNGSYTQTVTNGGCSSTSTPTAVTVNALPTAPTSITPTTTPVALGSTITYTETGGSGTSYVWTITGGTGSGSTNTNSVTWTTAGTTESVAVAAIANGCTSAVFTLSPITVSSAVSWTGTTNTNWATATNWSPAIVPTSVLNVTIQLVANEPIISSSTVANCNNITINASSSLTLASGSALNVYGNVTNNGTITDNGGTTSFIGSSAQTYSGPSGGTTLTSATLNNSNGLTLNNPLTIGGTTTVGGTLTLTSGTITTGGNLTVNLYKGGISGAGTGAISGNLTVTKHVDTAGYHYISAPMPNCTVSDIDAALGYSTEYFYNMFWYNETNTSTADSIGWTNANNATNYPAYPALTAMRGFALYFFNPGTLSYTKTYTTNNYTSSIPLTSTISGNSSADGWNLVGNPYPSSINWNASGWTKTGIDSAVYFYNPATHTYASYATGAGTNGGTNIIPSMQAYWVHVTSDGDNSRSLGITNSASVRSTTGSPLLWRSGVAQNYLSITAASTDGTLIDESIIRIVPGATDGFDPGYDAYKLMSDAGYMSFFSRSAGDSLSINSLSDVTTNFNLPLLLKTPAGSYNFNFSGALSFQNYDVILTDKLLGTYQDLKQSPTYPFTLAGTDTTPRFYLNLRKAGTTTTSGVTSLITGNNANTPNVIINNNNNGVIVNFVDNISNSADLTLYNILGENIWESKNTDISSGSYSIDANAFPSGIYILRVIIDSKTYSKKIYLVK